MSGDAITRRQAILAAGAAAAAAAMPDTALAQAKKLARPVALAAGKFLDARELAILDEVAELIIPADANPVAHARRNAPLYIDARLAESIDPLWRQSWKDDLAEIDEIAIQMFGRSILEASPAERAKLMDRISKNERKPIENVEHSFGTIKWWVAEAYYTSQIGIQDELKYQGNSYIDEFIGTDVSHKDRR